MKPYLFISLCLMASLRLAAAVPPPVDNATLGQLEARVNYCGQIYPAQNTQYQNLLNVPLAGTPPANLPAMRSSDAYKQTYSATTAQLAATSKDAVSAACTNALTSYK